jgi:GNAT superfamily N-acetyltransferase
MSTADLPEVTTIAGQVHPDYPEEAAVFAERLSLYPAGCLVLAEGGSSGGYVLSHPWHARRPPLLNSMLHAIPADARTYYIHDIALLPAWRGHGAAATLVARLIHLARQAGLASLSLVAVNGSLGFWQRQGFRVAHDAALAGKLASYDDAARYMTHDLTS